MYSLNFEHIDGDIVKSGKNLRKDIRPIFYAEVNKVIQICLLDTDATLPMFYGSEMQFDSRFSGNACYVETINIKTAGKEDLHSKVFKVRNFVLGGGYHTIIFDNMFIALVNEEREYDIVLSASMFNDTELDLKMRRGLYSIFIERAVMKVSYMRGYINCSIAEY